MLHILCPYCFNSFPVGQIKYRCMNRNCKTIYIDAPHPDSKGNCQCPDCRRRTSAKVCPECEHTLPEDILEGSTKVISIVGVKSSGKSYYVGALLKQLMEGNFLPRNYGIAPLWERGSREEYQIRFAQLFAAGIPLPGTDKKTDLIQDYPPLLIRFSLSRKKLFWETKEMYTFSFFDAAGESFADEQDLATITPYLQNSTAMVLILDPRQIKHIDQAVCMNFPGLGDIGEQPCTQILGNVLTVLRTEPRLARRSDQKIRIPICIAISKWDLLLNIPDLLPDGLTVGDPNRLQGDYDETMFNSISGELRSLLMEWDPALVTIAEQNFVEVRFFAFSAWGSPPTANGTVPQITPIRVEDPMLWVMHREGMI